MNTNCPNCNYEECLPTETDEINFDNNRTGHFYADYWCPVCKKYFRHCFKFNYTITKEWNR